MLHQSAYLSATDGKFVTRTSVRHYVYLREVNKDLKVLVSAMETCRCLAVISYNALL